MSKAEPGKQIAKTAEAGTALSTAAMFESHAGSGLENVTKDDMLVPRLTILQDLSPQLKKGKSEFIPNAEVGDICDVGTGEIFKEGVLFLPVYYRKEYLEWAPRASGKGLVNIHPTAAILDQCTKDEKGRQMLPNGNYVAETAQFYGLNLSAGRRWCFIPMTSTQLKKARKWITLATSEKLRRGDGSEYVAPLFFRSYMLTTADESNNEGEWKGWVVNRDASLPEYESDTPWQAIGEEAIAFREVLLAGTIRGDMSEPADGEQVVEDAM